MQGNFRHVRLQEQFGQNDIYLFDQILRGNVTPTMRVLDAGCGLGRALVYLPREGWDGFAVDADDHAVEHVRRLAGSLAKSSPAENFLVDQPFLCSQKVTCAMRRIPFYTQNAFILPQLLF